MKRIAGFAALVMVAVLAGCGAGSKAEMMTKIDNAKTIEEVRKALGKPTRYEATDVAIFGKVETLEYTASDGIVVVTGHNGKVFTKATGEKK